jgi:hypothetical protein
MLYLQIPATRLAQCCLLQSIIPINKATCIKHELRLYVVCYPKSASFLLGGEGVTIGVCGTMASDRYIVHLWLI